VIEKCEKAKKLSLYEIILVHECNIASHIAPSAYTSIPQHIRNYYYYYSSLLIMIDNLYIFIQERKKKQRNLASNHLFIFRRVFLLLIYFCCASTLKRAEAETLIFINFRSGDFVLFLIIIILLKFKIMQFSLGV
jgi:hypothetical protein